MPKGLIVKALSGYYYIQPEEGSIEQTIQCRARGIFKKKGVSPLVGDRVIFTMTENGEGTVDEIEPRVTELIRPPISNVGLAALVFSVVEPVLNRQLLDKFLVHIEHAGLDAVIVLTKWDIIETLPPAEAAAVGKDMEHIIEVYARIGYDVIPTSAAGGYGYERLADKLTEDISVFAGQSGVGKSSLLNAMIPGIQLETNQISQRLGRGKHTTRHVELLQLPHGGYIADTPGFSQLDFLELGVEQLGTCFREFHSYAENCKFRGCTHIHEPSCQVKEAVANGQIDKTRYEHYVLFFEEMKDKKRRY
ncbi:ribosome small subunit-dependent GTPase A [Paenibacillus profundus]|uniref:Small ribosomal subunit biogenesis GTPase RsgA n=1 Tax=Paenibacillus profundus TaxID=1173085 RepID=A0ABS8YC63_9BACL|nr:MULTISPECIES: ribosome small subunit-dependent GTPase A [Paenibacillus]MCE5167946.1 ribosome small subunit-dependent GTPase A [Paenibacillus profundus]MCM3337196.1 ribosome small subunit-dependent GTPase A [Paenibacillus sp. MER TA 81-3]